MPHLAIGPAMLISSLIGGGASIAGSALSGSKDSRTSTSGPTYSPEMQALQKKLLDYSGSLMDNPTAGLQPMKNVAAGNINRNYRNVPNLISKKMAARGYGSSGEMGDSMYQTELGRMGDMSSLEGLFAKLALDRQDQGSTIGQNLLRMGTGTTSTGPGSAAGNGLMSAGNGLENISTMLMMSKLLGGGSSAYGNSAGYTGYGSGTGWNPGLGGE